MKWHTQRCHDSSKALLKDQGVGGGPNPRNLHPFPKIARIILPLISVWITQPIKTNHTKFCHHICPLQCPSLCGVCFSLYLNKSNSYPPLCLSLNSFYGETSRTQASLGPETRYRGLWLGLSPAIWVQVSSRVLAGFESQPCGFKSKAEFWLGLSPSHVGLSPNLW